MQSRFFLSFLIFAFLSLFSAQSYCLEQGTDLRISKITINVEKVPTKGSFDPQIIMKRLNSQEGNVFSQYAFDEDLKALSKDFDRVDPEIEYIQNEVFITLNLWPFPQIREITFDGNVKIKSETLKKELDLEAGSTFKRNSFLEAFQKLKNYYLKKGYFEAELSYKINPDPVTNEVDISFLIKEGRSGYVRSIDFRGISDSEESELLELMITKEYNFFLSWITNEGMFNEEQLERDKYIIVDYLHNKGYADAVVNIQVMDVAGKDRVDFLIDIQKQQQYFFGETTINGHHVFTTEEITKIVNGFLKKSDPYSPAKLREATRALSRAYGEKGYIDAAINYIPKLNANDNSYDITFTIDEGLLYRVGMIKIFGNSTTQSRVILHETLLVPGEIFNTVKMEKSEQRLYNIGFFENVNVYAVAPDEKSSLGPGYRDVHIEVAEKSSTGNIRFFGAYNQTASFLAGIKLTESNFNYQGAPNLFSDGITSIRGAGEYFNLSLSIGKNLQTYGTSWTKPYFLDTKWTVGIDLERIENNKTFSDDYYVENFMTRLRASYLINPFLRFAWNYRLKNTNITLTASNPSQRLAQEASNDGVTSSTALALIYDSTDHPLEPSSGFLSKIEGEFAGLGGDTYYTGFNYTNSYYHALSKRDILKFRADMHLLFPIFGDSLSDIPLDQRLYLGGEMNPRGYRPYSLGPLFDDGSASGGCTSSLASIEYSHRFTKMFSTFTFLDAAQVEEGELSFGEVRYATGLGMRLKVAQSMPITFGFGLPLNDESKSEVKNFFINLSYDF